MSERLTSVTIWMGEEIPCRDKIDNSLRVCACMCMRACQRGRIHVWWKLYMTPVSSRKWLFSVSWSHCSVMTDARRPQGFRRVTSSSSAARSRFKQASLLTHFQHVYFLALWFVFPLSLPCLPAIPPPASSPRSLSKEISWWNVCASYRRCNIKVGGGWPCSSQWQQWWRRRVQGRKHFFFWKKEACSKGESNVTQSRASEMNALWLNLPFSHLLLFRKSKPCSATALQPHTLAEEAFAAGQQTELSQQFFFYSCCTISSYKSPISIAKKKSSCRLFRLIEGLNVIGSLNLTRALEG